MRAVPAGIQLGRDIDQHQPGHPARELRRVRHRRKSAHRMADHQRALELEFFDEVLDVAHLARQAVVADRRPFAVAMAALVERDAVVLAAQRQAYEIPGMRVEPAAVQEKYRTALRGTPIEVVEAHPIDHDVVILGEG